MASVNDYFLFLRFSLFHNVPDYSDEEKKLFKRIDWHGLYAFGKKQSILGLLYQGILKLPQGCFTDVDLLSKWTVIAQKLRLKNQQVNKTATDVFDRFSKDGWRLCMVKGQGNAILYPNSYSRSPGDIDLWVLGKQDGSIHSARQLRKELSQYVKETFGKCTTNYYQAKCEVNGIEIEAHLFPSIVNSWVHNRRQQKWYRKYGDLQCSNLIQLPDTDGKVAVSTVHFNLVQQLAHIYEHFFAEGIGLRQLIDYYYQCKAYSELQDKDYSVLRHDLQHLGMYKFAGAVMWVLASIIDMPKEVMIADADERRGKVLLDEILNGGNFGHHDKKYGGITRLPMAKKYFVKLHRSLTFFFMYPTEAISEPLFRTWHFAWRFFHQNSFAK